MQQMQDRAFIDGRDLEYLQIVPDADAAAGILLEYYGDDCP